MCKYGKFYEIRLTQCAVTTQPVRACRTVTQHRKLDSVADLLWAVSAGEPFAPHLLLLCFFFALGIPYGQCSALLPGLLPQTFERLSRSPLVLAKVKELKERFLAAAGVGEYDFRLFMPAAMKAIGDYLNDPGAPPDKKQELARWVSEKVTGKAVPAASDDSSFTLADVHTLLEEIRIERADPVVAASGPSATEDTKSAADKWAATIPRETE